MRDEKLYFSLVARTLPAMRRSELGECLEWRGACGKAGYGQKSIGGRLFLTHRLAWGAVNGPIPMGMLVCHKCDNPPCIASGHLFLGTYADNARDAANKGRSAFQKLSIRCDGKLHRGEAHPMAKLTLAQVHEVIDLYAAGGVTYDVLSHVYGVSITAVHKIVTHKKWDYSWGKKSVAEKA